MEPSLKLLLLCSGATFILRSLPLVLALQVSLCSALYLDDSHLALLT